MRVGEVNIEGKVISMNHPPFIVAEMSGNHNQSLERALAIIDAAADIGVHAVKLQTYTPDTLTIDVSSRDFLIHDAQSPWHGKNLHQLYKSAMLPWDWHEALFDHCRKRNLICFSSPFDETAVDFLEDLNCPCYKIASFENVHFPLIRKVAATGKPVILSTGMASSDDLKEAVRAVRMAGCRDLILLKCTSSYPASPKSSNILTIPHLQETFGCQVGLSDHTLGVGVAVASVALGATFIEKHFTLSRAEGGVDATFSLEPSEMKVLVDEATRAWEALGQVFYGPTESEQSSVVFRRSLYIVKDMRAGEKLSPENTRIIRPGYGLHPRHFDEVMGKKVKKDISKGTPLGWELIREG